MKTWIIIFKSIGYIWIALAIAFILFGMYGVWRQEGFGGVQQLLSPFNVINWVATFLTLAPGVGALFLAGRFEKRLSNKDLA